MKRELSPFHDRELSWLEFDSRVLELAKDSSIPLFERLKFLAIFSSNLDEFFMVRVASLMRKIEFGGTAVNAAGHAPRELLALIQKKTQELVHEQTNYFKEVIIPELKVNGIEIAKMSELTQFEIENLNVYYKSHIYPVLTPLVVDPSHPFPHISGLSLNIGVSIDAPAETGIAFARVKVPTNLPRFIQTSAEGVYRFVLLDDLIAANLSELFPGVDIHGHFFFRVTRNQDIDLEEEDSEDLLLSIEKGLSQRRFGPPVRLEVDKVIDPKVLKELMGELEISKNDVIQYDSPLDLKSLNQIADLNFPHLKYKSFQSEVPPELREIDRENSDAFFGAIRRNEILLHHPYQSFSSSVVQFLQCAAKDPKVLAIKQTLYRTSGDSPIVEALIEAAESGKQVLAVIEIRARFDEVANVRWARKLEEVGVHVVYGIMGLKTHAKLSLVVRQESSGIARYCHVGTGNYNPKTARFYDDLGMLSSNPELGEDLTRLFNTLSGHSNRHEYSRVLVAPHKLRSGLLERIEREKLNHLNGKPSWIRFKLNSLLDEQIISALYSAAEAGVPIQIIVRGICGLQLNTSARKANIKVRSILGRFLEHSRIYYFHNAGEDEYWIGSADLMHRNLDRRVEALTRIDSDIHKAKLKSILDDSMNDSISSWHLSENNEWVRHSVSGDGSPLLDFQSLYISKMGRN